MGLARIPRRRAGHRPVRGLAAERGSLLVEVMVSAMIVLVVGFGVLAIVDRTTDLSGEQRQQAIAVNLAQTELDTVKAFPISKLSNMHRTSTQTVSTVVYTIVTDADWVSDSSMKLDDDKVSTPNCTTPGAGFDYLNVRTTVTHPNMGARSPTTLNTLITPPVRSFNANQGSLAVLVTDGATPPKPVKGLSVSLTGPATFTDDTNANGCILWGYLPAGNGYALAFSKTGYVTPSGSPGGGSASVIGDAPTTLTYMFDRGGSIRTNFKVRNPPGGVLVDTKPQVVRVDNGGPPSFTRTYDIGATSSLDTSSSGLLFPFTNPYSVYADNCLAAKPTTNLTQPTLTAADPDPVPASETVLPALDITVTRGGPVLAGATVRVITTCGTVYTRQTNSAGKLDDPGFPYGTGFTLCATDGTRKRVVTAQANTSFANAGTAVAMAIPTSGSTPNPTACP
jgi:hypothetical protein